MNRYNMWTDLACEETSLDVGEIGKSVREQMDMSMEVSDTQVYELIDQIILERTRGSHLNLRQKTRLREQVFNSLRKLDILQELLDDGQITEIMINGTACIFIEREGRLLQLDKHFLSRRKLEDVIQQIVAGANRLVNEASPIVDARLEDGSRVNVVLYPIAINGPVVTIRKFPKEAMTMQELVRRAALSEELAAFLGSLIRSRYNVFVSGGTGSG